MSWLFGYSRPQNTGGGGEGGIPIPPPPPPKKDDKKKLEEAMSGFRFDSEALERAARAAKELENSSITFYLMCHFILRACEGSV